LEATMAVRLTVTRRDFDTGQAQAEVAPGALGVDDPARQDRQAGFQAGGLHAFEIEPLAAGIRACKLLRQQLSAAGVRFPRDVPRRIAVVKFTEAREILFAAGVMLAV